MLVQLHQALYGYADGHRLISSSQPIDERETRDLRAVTDMAFDGEATSHLTCVPVDVLNQHALIRSWPAYESARPGSVWSHVIFIGFVDLGQAADLQTLLSLFKRPSVEVDGTPDSGPYRRPLVAELNDRPRYRPNANSFDDSYLIWAAYGNDASVVRSANLGAAEETLMAMWEQQWPRLRRSFRFRTRYRTSEQASFRFDVQAVERLTRGQEAAHPPLEPPVWLDRLGTDLKEPSDHLRAFLRRYGAESDAGPGHVGPLAELEARLAGGFPPRAVAELVWGAFPGLNEMPTLKRNLFGQGSTEWSATELQRLACIATASPQASLDLDDLDYRNRLESLWHSHPQAAIDLTLASLAEPSSETQREILDIAVAVAEPAHIDAYATSDYTFAKEVLQRRQDLLPHDEVWTYSALTRDVASSVLSLVDDLARARVLDVALERRALAAAAACVEQDPTVWWQALETQGGNLAKPGVGLSESASALRELLESTGHAAIGSPPSPPRDPKTLALIAATLEPSEGLWRRVPTECWAELGDVVIKTADEKSRTRVALVLLLAALRTATSPSQRERLWRASFRVLHEAAVRNRLSNREALTIADLLAAQGRETPAAALRNAAAREAIRNRWSAADSAQLVADAEPFSSAMTELLRPPSKKRKGWFRELLDLLP